MKTDAERALQGALAQIVKAHLCIRKPYGREVGVAVRHPHDLALEHICAALEGIVTAIYLTEKP